MMISHLICDWKGATAPRITVVDAQCHPLVTLEKGAPARLVSSVACASQHQGSLAMSSEFSTGFSSHPISIWPGPKMVTFRDRLAAARCPRWYALASWQQCPLRRLVSRHRLAFHVGDAGS